MSPKRRTRYTAEFKVKALQLLETGKPIAEVAQEFSISTNLLYSWKYSAQRPQGGSAGLRATGESSAADELRALRRELTRLKVENDILKKAAVILGTKPPPNSAS